VSMLWQRASFRGQKVWANVVSAGKVHQEGGRVAIRYSSGAGAKLYRAGAGRVELEAGGELRDLPEGQAAPEAAQRSGRSKGSGFGSAKTRTVQQKAMAVDAARALLSSLSEETVICYTDGACRGNPGPAGAGALVVLPGGKRGTGSLDLGEGTNNIAELTAIDLALTLLDEAQLPPAHPVALLSDSAYANGVLCKGWKAKKNRELILGLRERLGKRPGVTVYWVAGHAGIEGNECADTLANRGVEGLSTTTWEEGAL
jgi:ribonuclease HI